MQRGKYDHLRLQQGGATSVRTPAEVTSNSGTPSKARKPTNVEFKRSYDIADRNDIGNAAHFVRRFGDSLRYLHAWKKWIVWDGTRWRVDDDGTPIRLAKEVVREMFEFGLAQQNNSVIQLAGLSASKSRLDAMVALAQSELPIRLDDLDSDPWLLNCPNGVVDLRTGRIRDHRREDFLMQVCPTNYIPAARAPTWDQFLTDIFADAPLRGFVQRLMGYWLTGDVSEQKLPILFGSGANGKSTLLNAFLDVLGNNYSMQAMPDLLMERRGSSHPTELAALFGKRFVSCVETEASQNLAESKVKTLTGGERIQARRMREDFWEFAPTHKMALCTNHKPSVAGQDHGIWRRLLLVPFEQRFDESQIDKRMPEKLKAESPGILAWLVKGCLDWQNNGLTPPEKVVSATQAYRSKEDVIGRFLQEECEVGHNLAASSAELWFRLERWCLESGDDCPSRRTFGTWLGNAGFSKGRSNGVVWRGLMLKASSQYETEP